MIHRINAMLAALEQCEFIPDEDVAWVAVSSSDIKLIPGEIFRCPVRFVDCVKYHGAIDVANSKRISNPGCFASGMQSLLRPIKSVLTHYPIVAAGISGYTAGGKSAISKQKSHPQPHKMTNITRVHTHANEVRFRSGIPNELIFMPAVGSFAEGQVISIPLARHQLTIPIEYAYQHFVDYYHNNPLVVVLDEAPKSICPDELIDKDRIRICVAEFENHVVLHAWYSNLNFGAAGSVARIIDKIAEERATNGLRIAR